MMKHNYLKLYVVANTPSAEAAVAAVTEMCEHLLSGEWKLEIIDVIESPEKAEEELISAVPALVVPKSTKRVVGDLTNPHDIIIALNLKKES